MPHHHSKKNRPKYSLGGVPRPDHIYMCRHPDQKELETISSTGYYHQSNKLPPIKITHKETCFAFSVAQQFNGYALPSPRTYSPSCCSYDQYIEYQGVRIPANHCPDLWQLFDKYKRYDIQQNKYKGEKSFFQKLFYK